MDVERCKKCKSKKCKCKTEINICCGKGLPGPPGPKGDTGEKGDPGPKGDTGDTGKKGERGDTGAPGPKGDTGAPGPKGDTGDTGAVGPKGDTGDTGAPGPKGDTGDTGAPGPKGDTGDTGVPGTKGDTGDTGAVGPKGDTGDTGAVGPKGDTGSPLFCGNTVFVDSIFGNDLTGVRQNASLPFFSLSAAESAALGGDQIVVRTGTYAAGNLSKADLSWYFEPGTIVTNNGNSLFNVSGNLQVLGYAKFLTINPILTSTTIDGNIVRFNCLTISDTGTGIRNRRLAVRAVNSVPAIAAFLLSGSGRYYLNVGETLNLPICLMVFSGDGELWYQQNYFAGFNTDPMVTISGVAHFCCKTITTIDAQVLEFFNILPGSNVWLSGDYIYASSLLQVNDANVYWNFNEMFAIGGGGLTQAMLLSGTGSARIVLSGAYLETSIRAIETATGNTIDLSINLQKINCLNSSIVGVITLGGLNSAELATQVIGGTSSLRIVGETDAVSNLRVTGKLATKSVQNGLELISAGTDSLLQVLLKLDIQAQAVAILVQNSAANLNLFAKISGPCQVVNIGPNFSGSFSLNCLALVSTTPVLQLSGNTNPTITFSGTYRATVPGPIIATDLPITLAQANLITPPSGNTIKTVKRLTAGPLVPVKTYGLVTATANVDTTEIQLITQNLFTTDATGPSDPTVSSFGWRDQV